MEYTRLSDIKLEDHIGGRVYATFLCRDLELRTKKNGIGQYMNLTIQDRHCIETGVKIFELNDYTREMVKEGFVYEAAIDVQKYDMAKNGYSLSIYNISMIADDSKNYFDWCDGLADAASVIIDNINKINDATYSRITSVIMSDNWESFVLFPAASSMHHSQLGGLCKHTCEVLTMALKIAQEVENNLEDIDLDYDLIRAAAILHDIGKVKEFSVDAATGKAVYAPEAALGTHITTAVRVIDRVVFCMDTEEASYGSDDDTKVQLLEHCILSHHGKKEYGSPIEPSIPEAYIVSKADTISADMYRFGEAISGLQSGESKTAWSSGKLEVYYKK